MAPSSGVRTSTRKTAKARTAEQNRKPEWLMDEPVARSCVVTVIEHFGYFQSRRCRDFIAPATYQQKSFVLSWNPAAANLPVRGIGGSASPYRRNGGSFAR